MSARHTPGPWTRHGQHIYSGTTLIARDIEEPTDADLMTAAPDLLEALRDVLTRVTLNGQSAAWPEYDKARALLARLDA